ncbi:hypothetical protein KEM48_001032 [Puccinia striiformis f. sp. tritici PST-130]|nr:hypothetical protein KEM48_001032 [Puccinia striiformis f. sp. tritici PST-130]
MDEISYEQRQRALQYELSPGGAARLQRLGVKPAAAGRRIAILGPDVPPPDQGINPALINSRETSLALESNRGMSMIPESTRSTPVPATSGQGTLQPPGLPVPNSVPTGTAPARSQPTRTPSTDREDSMDIIVDRPGLDSLIAVLNGQWEMLSKHATPGHLHDEVFPQRGRRNASNDAESSRPRRDDPAQFELERSGRISDDDAPTRPPDVTPNQVLPSAHHVAGSIPVLNHTTPGSHLHHLRRHPRRQGMGQISLPYPSKLRGTIGSARSVPDPNGLRIRTSHHIPVPATSQPVPARPPELERIREEQEKNPECDVGSPKDGQFFMRAEAVMGRIRRARQNRTPNIIIRLETSLQPRIKSIFTAYTRQPV